MLLHNLRFEVFPDVRLSVYSNLIFAGSPQTYPPIEVLLLYMNSLVDCPHIQWHLRLFAFKG